MNRWTRLLFFACFVVVVGSAAWTLYAVQRARADETSATANAVADVYDTVVQTENAARDYLVAHAQTALDTYTDGRSRIDLVTAHTRDLLRDGELGGLLHRELTRVDEWKAAVDADMAAAIAAGHTVDADATRAAARGALLSGIRAEHDRLVHAIQRDDRDERDAAGLRGILVVVGLCALFALCNWILFIRTERRETRARDRQAGFAERLQSARSEDDARAMLARHLEDLAPGSLAIVTTADDTSTVGRPIMVGGERIGTVLLRSPRDLKPATERLVHDTILRAGPVLANLRTLEVAQARAATDPLTGLGNRRLVEDALGRVVAQSRRSGEGFAVAMVDLDSFKAVNDTYGHAAGDALLIAVAETLNHETREYDVVGRQGGDEFIVLLTGITPAEATAVMERCCAALAALRVGPEELGTTASVGVATAGADDPGDPSSLVRAADDAVYVAKARGGNCVVAATRPHADVQASAFRA